MAITGKRPFRFVFTGENDGFTNMAMDEAVLSGLKEGFSTPVLRVYQWNPPAISIGYFQKASDIDFEKCVRDGIGVVRRLTGGRAVLHFEELTYSILFTEEDFIPFKKKEIFNLVSLCLLDSLNILGIESRVVERSRGNLKSPNCFASPAQYEIETLDKKKIIGSAQLIREGILLQHGAIPITTSYSRISSYVKCPDNPSKKVSSLNTLSNFEIFPEDLLASLRAGFSNHLPLNDGFLNEYELKKIPELVEKKYSQREWMFKK